MTNCRTFKLLCVCGALGLVTSSASGDGGALRFRRDLGFYQATVFTESSVLRTGPVDVSVLVEDQRTGEFVTDVRCALVIRGTDQPHSSRSYVLSGKHATNKLFQSARVDFPVAGVWRVDLHLADAAGEEQGTFQLRVNDARPRWVELIPWIAFPFVVIVVFGVHEKRVLGSS